MPATLPHSVRETPGPDASEELDEYFHALLSERAAEKSEYRSDMTEVKTRLSSLEQGQAELRREMTTRLDAMQGQMLEQTRWLVGSVTLFGTILSILLAIGQFL